MVRLSGLIDGLRQGVEMDTSGSGGSQRARKS